MPSTDEPLVIQTTLEEVLSSTPELHQSDIQHLQEWMKKQPHLPKRTDLQLVPFLHSCYYSLERTKSCIENFFTIRTHAPEIFCNRDVKQPSLQKNLDSFLLTMMPEQDSKGNFILCTKFASSDSSNFYYPEAIKLALMMLDIAVKENPVAPGYILVMDMNGTTLGHLTKASIALGTLKKLFVFVQEGFPVRMKAIHIINANSLLDPVMSLVKPLINKDLFDLVHFHTTSQAEDFYKLVPRNILPEEFGGTGGNMMELYNTMIRPKVDAYNDWLIELEKVLVDESKRMDKSKSAGKVFGMEGSFKKLDID